ncbi:MAG TPA: esterase-like activity of phytase family protein [Allosphingosinicella sp.]|nr:esterase-like activity of phytase family protein [Allosphingosinicella sp.]
MKLGGFPERIWRRRWSRAAALPFVFILLATIVAPARRPAPATAPDAPLVYAPVVLQADAPGRRDVGRLHFLGGWSLSSPDDRLGGLSGLHVENGQAIAISDAGTLVHFPLPGTSPEPRVRFQPVTEGPGPTSRRSTRDTEALMVQGDRLWLSFERYNAIWRYDRSTLRGQSGARPPLMRRWPGNSGPETMVRLADGRVLVIAEGLDNGAPYSDALLFAGDPAVETSPVTRLRYRRTPGFRPTDAALLPDGRILILNRRLSVLRLSARLTVADVRGLAAGGIIESQEVALLEAPLAIDNMEGLAVSREQGRTIVWLLSDDDFMRLFRHTLLMKFELRL